MRVKHQTQSSNNRRGYTLLELVIGLGSATLLCGGMASAISVASRGMEATDSPQAQTADVVTAQRQIARDLQHALRFTERTATAITLLVPDRDNNGLPESVRYAWSGTPGDPLTYSLNGGTPVNIEEDVQSFAFNFETRAMTAPALVINPSPAATEPPADSDEAALAAEAKVDTGSGTASTESTTPTLEEFLESEDTGKGKGKGKKK